MNVFVVGATGRVGRKVVEGLTQRGYFVYAGARKVDQLHESQQVKPIFTDLHAPVEQLAEGLGDAEAVLFVAGSRGQDLLQTDLHGAVKMAQAAQLKGITRYIQLSSMFALNPEKWGEPALASLLNYTIAKHYADQWLVKDSALDYTIVQPGTLTETSGTGKIAVGVSEAGKNSIENVAETLIDLLEAPNTIGHVIAMHDGEQPIREALQNIK